MPTSELQPEVFINYRRDDSSGHAGRLFDAPTPAIADADAGAVTGQVLSLDWLRRRWVRASLAAAVVVVAALILSRPWSSGGGRPAGFNGQTPHDPGTPAPPSRDPDVATGAAQGAALENPAARLPASGEARAGDASFKVLGGLIGRDAGGSRPIRLLVRTTNVRARYGFSISGDSYRLIVAGRATPPDEAPIEVIAMQSAIEGWVSFRAPADAAAAVLQVGDIHQATAKIPIDLGSATTDLREVPAPAWRHPVDLAVAFEKRVGPVVFNIEGMRLEHFADAVAQVQPEKLELSVKLRMKNVGARNGDGVGPDDFRLLIDDVPLAPTKYPIQVLTYQDDADAELVFVIPGTATNAILQLGNIGAATVRVPVDLSPARLPSPR